MAPHNNGIPLNDERTLGSRLNPVDWVSLVLMIVGAVNWGLVGAFNFNLVAALFGEATLPSRVIYVLVGLAGLYGIATAAKCGRRI